MPEPVYITQNVKPAYQLLYSLTVFWRTGPGADSWLPELQDLTEADGVRILAHRFPDPRTSLFLISTKPSVAPTAIPSHIKGSQSVAEDARGFCQHGTWQRIERL